MYCGLWRTSLTTDGLVGRLEMGNRVTSGFVAIRCRMVSKCLQLVCDNDVDVPRHSLLSPLVDQLATYLQQSAELGGSGGSRKEIPSLCVELMTIPS